MKILCCDTSTPTAYLFLGEYQEDYLLWYESTAVVWNNTHSEQLLDRLLRMCSDHNVALSDIDLFGASSGPGSFTGLRIALATMKGLAMGLNTPLVSTPTLELYQNLATIIGGPCLVAIDAKKQRYYTAFFVDGSQVGQSSDLSADEIDALLAPYEQITLIGSDGPKLAGQLNHLGITIVDPSLLDVGVELADRVRKHYLERGADSLDQGPTYIRKSDAERALKES